VYSAGRWASVWNASSTSCTATVATRYKGRTYSHHTCGIVIRPDVYNSASVDSPLRARIHLLTYLNVSRMYQSRNGTVQVLFHLKEGLTHMNAFLIQPPLICASVSHVPIV
jgi:hypothetical protein